MFSAPDYSNPDLCVQVEIKRNVKRKNVKSSLNLQQQLAFGLCKCVKLM